LPSSICRRHFFFVVDFTVKCASFRGKIMVAQETV
jgi:hypothetical protein